MTTSVLTETRRSANQGRHRAVLRRGVVGWRTACAGMRGAARRAGDAAATIGSVAPRHADGLDWLNGMGRENLDEFAAAEAGEEYLLAYLEREGAEVASAAGSELHAALGDLLSEVDREALTGEFADYFAASARKGLANGVWGWFDDDIAFIRDWGNCTQSTVISRSRSTATAKCWTT